MELRPDAEFVSICEDILARGHTDAEWSERESSDEFQTGRFCGGYEALEHAFCFSYHDASDTEWWLTVTLDEVQSIAAGEAAAIPLRRPT